ncbi:cytochrome b/b6 domain-containing protein [Pseudomonas hormoni]|uniref:Cytochrome b/b6 domain-containing protein n=1 Tax=Pseudomonas hormoni TaxID=3093767 RepID=A0ABX8F686_9PSED|nr:cytochrome b/b6 domain-containing protein [Pseudomonas hormoni]QVW27021.1 cytochrome b/b6 domain-containing protein [Pseudomonas hormoni]
MTVLGYSTQRVWLHWLSAAVIVWTLISGFYVACVDVSPWVAQWVAFLNVSLTTVFIPFFVWRLFIFAAHARDTSVRGLNFMEKPALFAHTLIYLVISVVLVTGVLMMDRPIGVFGVVEIAQPLSDPELISRFFIIHVWACAVLSLLVVLHVGAVVVHELCGHRVLRRMSLCSIVRSERLE